MSNPTPSQTRDLQVEWLNLGKDPSKFTVAKMQSLNSKASQKALSPKQTTSTFPFRSQPQNQDYETNNLSAKQEQIEDKRGRGVDFSAIGSSIVGGVKLFGFGVTSVTKGAAKLVQPGFIRSRSNFKEGSRQIKDVEREQSEAYELRKITRTQLAALVEVDDVSRNANLEAIKREEPTAAIAKKIKIDQETLDRHEDMERFLKRREQDHNDVLKARADEAEVLRIKKEKEVSERRAFSKEFWGKKKTELANNAVVVRRRKDREIEENKQTVETQDFLEIQHSKNQIASNQIVGPAVSSQTLLPSGKRLGVFGIPSGSGEFMSRHNGGDVAGVDDFDVNLFGLQSNRSTNGGGIDVDTAFEKNNNEYNVFYSKQVKKEELYASVTDEIKQCKDEIDILTQTKHRMSLEITQNNNEQATLQLAITGPPRRDPTPNERVTINGYKERARKLARDFGGLNGRETKLNAKLDNLAQQSLRIAVDVGKIREDCKALRKDLDATNSGLLPPPLIVGTSLGKNITEFRANPQRTYDELTLRSNLEIIKAQSKPALNAHKDARKLEHGVWSYTQRLMNEKTSVEGLLTRLAGASERMKVGRGNNLRMDLIEAVKGFWKAGEMLDRVNVEVNGRCDWWSKRRLEETRNVGRTVSNEDEDDGDEGGVANSGNVLSSNDGRDKDDDKNQQGLTLLNSSTSGSGSIAGTIKLPTYNLYNINLTITKSKPKNESNTGKGKGRGGHGDPADYVTIRFGTTPKNLTQVCTVYNVPNVDTGMIRYNVTYSIRTDVLAFRFDFFTSASASASAFNSNNSVDGNEGEGEHEDTQEQERFTISLGTYTLKTLDPLEQIVDKETGTSRVLSEYIKKIRIEEQQPNARGTHLVQELVLAEESTSKLRTGGAESEYWDSGVLFGVFSNTSGGSITDNKLNQGHGQTILKRGEGIKGKVGGYKCRYPKAVFVKLVKDELQRIHQASIDEEDGKNGIGGCSFEELVKDTKKRLGLNREQRKQYTLQVSRRDYLLRKRAPHLARIAEMERLVNFNISIFNVSTKEWEKMYVKRFVISWVDNGTLPRMIHTLTPADALDGGSGSISIDENENENEEDTESDADAVEVDLRNERYYVLKEVIDNGLAKERWKRNEALRKAKLKLERRTSKALLKENKASEERKIKEAQQFVVAKENAIEKARVFAGNEADGLLMTPAVKTVIASTVKSVYYEMRVGITSESESKAGSDSGSKASSSNAKVTMKTAKVEATKRWKEKYVDGRVEEAEDIWNNAVIQRASDEDYRRDDSLNLKALETASNAARSLREAQEETTAITLRTTALIKTLAIKNFEKACPKASMCEHLRVRSWGDSYGSGLRCLTCGKELGNTDTEGSQLMGIGSGEDEKLVEDVKLHRMNWSSFRFRDSQHLAQVERERGRLDKEIWDMKLVEDVFYDYSDGKTLYTFDLRHRVYLKNTMIVRQGVQWSTAELEELKVKQLEEIERMDPLLQMNAKKELDAFYGNIAPPTVRGEIIKRHASYRELLNNVSRINVFRTRIRELQEYRIEIVAERNTLQEQLNYLHIHVYKLEGILSGLGIDLQVACGRLEIREDARVELVRVREILRVAVYDLKVTNMDRVGVETIAYNTKEELLRAGEQVRAILRYRAMEERKTTALQTRATRARTNANELKGKLKETQDDIDAMHYRLRGQIVPTIIGPRRVLFYREVDGMLCVDFRVGRTSASSSSASGTDGSKSSAASVARMYVPMASCMALERGWQQANVIAMEREDIACRAFYKAEENICKKENAMFKVEDESMREREMYERNVKVERVTLENNVIAAVMNARKYLRTSDGRKEIDKRLNEALSDKVKERKLKVVQWNGLNKKPKVMMGYEKVLFKLDTKRRREMKKAFIVSLAKNAETETLEAMDNERNKKATATAFDFVFDSFLKSFMHDLASSALAGGIDAKERAEDDTGVVVSEGESNMQYGVYCTLRKWWIEKKTDLKKRLETWGVRSAQETAKLAEARKIQDDLELDSERREKIGREKKRQFDACSEMKEEEMQMRAFVKAELRLTLKERRAMGKEEQEMKMFIKEEQIFLEASKSKYNVITVSDDSNDGLSVKDKRRLEIKKSGAEKVRIGKEVALMMAEDELAFKVRTEAVKKEQLEMLKAEMDLWGGGEEDYGEDEGDNEEDYAVRDSSEEEEDSGEDDDVKAARVLVQVERRENIKTDVDVKRERAWRRSDRRARRVKISKRRDKQRKDAAELRIAEAWERARQEALVRHASREMEWMEEEEEARAIEKELKVHEVNVRKMRIYGINKGKEELRVKAQWKVKKEHSDACVAANQRAERWEKRCAYIEGKRRENYKLMCAQTKYMDSDAIARFQQRWETEVLKDKLHGLYFRTLAIIIANRAEVVAGERRMTRVQELLQTNQMETDKKTASMDSRWKKYQRDDLLRLYRSALGKKIFNKSRVKLLAAVYQGWVRYWLWHKGHKEAFELKYMMLKQEIDLRRLYPETREGEEAPQPVVKRTLLQRHKARPIQCRHCAEFYLETQNTNVSCAYHPGDYKVACPKSCAGSRDPKMVTTKCMSHRSTRWTCCDVREAGGVNGGKNGCEQRSHMPPAGGDPEYSARVLEQDVKDTVTLRKLDEELVQVRAQNHVLDAFKTKSDQLKVIAEKLTAERVIVKRYENLKFT